MTFSTVKHFLWHVDFGAMKIWIDRMSWYITKAATVSQLAIFWKLFGWSWWYLLGVPMLVALVWLERKRILPQEYGYGLRNNPEWQEHKRIQAEILATLKNNKLEVHNEQ
jgi:hypothetical protein